VYGKWLVSSRSPSILLTDWNIGGESLSRCLEHQKMTVDYKENRSRSSNGLRAENIIMHEAREAELRSLLAGSQGRRLRRGESLRMRGRKGGGDGMSTRMKVTEHNGKNTSSELRGKQGTPVLGVFGWCGGDWDTLRNIALDAPISGREPSVWPCTLAP